MTHIAAADRSSALATYGTTIDHPTVLKLKRFISGAAVPPAVQAEIVAELYPRSFRIGTSILTSIVTGSVLATIMHSWLPLAWMAVALALCGFRTLDWLSYQRSRERRSPSEWAVRFVVGFVPFGVWWGATAAVLLLSDDPLLMAIAVLACDAQGAGAVCSYPGHPPSAMSFVVPAMAMFGIAGLIRGGAIGYSITFVEVVLIANYLVIIREFYRSTVRGLIARQEKSEMADHLAEAHMALKREGAAKSEFLAHMSHELRTPLNAILGFSDVIMTETFGPIGSPKYAEYQADIHAAATHLLDIVNEVLDIARIEAGELTLQIDSVDPLDITRFAAKLIRQRAFTKGISFDVDVAPVLDTISIRTDEVRLKQALINILSNAVKFTPAGGSVKLSAGIEDGVFFQVSDTGVGMTPDDLERALLPFVQVGRPMVAQEGSGLGLPLSRQLIERLGGRFQIESSVGVGTTVTITMPNG